MPPVNRDKFLRYHSQWAQEIANRTHETTDLYMDEDGTPLMTIGGWPQKGTLVGTFTPVGQVKVVEVKVNV